MGVVFGAERGLGSNLVTVIVLGSVVNGVRLVIAAPGAQVRKARSSPTIVGDSLIAAGVLSEAIDRVTVRRARAAASTAALIVFALVVHAIRQPVVRVLRAIRATIRSVLQRSAEYGTRSVATGLGARAAVLTLISLAARAARTVTGEELLVPGDMPAEFVETPICSRAMPPLRRRGWSNRILRRPPSAPDPPDDRARSRGQGIRPARHGRIGRLARASVPGAGSSNQRLKKYALRPEQVSVAAIIRPEIRQERNRRPSGRRRR